MEVWKDGVFGTFAQNMSGKFKGIFLKTDYKEAVWYISPSCFTGENKFNSVWEMMEGWKVLDCLLVLAKNI